jgi:alpha-glucosidase
VIAIRRDNPALRNGDNMMLNTSDPNVFSYLRKNPGSGPSVLVAINFTSRPHTVFFQLKSFGIDGSQAQTLLQDSSVASNISLDRLKPPPFAVYIGQVQ